MRENNICVSGDIKEISSCIRRHSLENDLEVKTLHKFLEDNTGFTHSSQNNNKDELVLVVSYDNTSWGDLSIKKFLKESNATILPGEDVVRRKSNSHDYSLDEYDFEKLSSEVLSSKENNIGRISSKLIRLIDYSSRNKISRNESSHRAVYESKIIPPIGKVFTEMTEPFSDKGGIYQFTFIPAVIPDTEEMSFSVEPVPDITGESIINNYEPNQGISLEDYCSAYFVRNTSTVVFVSVGVEVLQTKDGEGREIAEKKISISNNLSDVENLLAVSYNSRVLWAIENMVPGTVVMLYKSPKDQVQNQAFSAIKTWIIHEDSIDGTSSKVSEDIYNNFEKFFPEYYGTFPNEKLYFLESEDILVSQFNSLTSIYNEESSDEIAKAVFGIK